MLHGKQIFEIEDGENFFANISIPKKNAEVIALNIISKYRNNPRIWYIYSEHVQIQCLKYVRL